MHCVGTCSMPTSTMIREGFIVMLCRLESIGICVSGVVELVIEYTSVPSVGSQVSSPEE